MHATGSQKRRKNYLLKRCYTRLSLTPTTTTQQKKDIEKRQGIPIEVRVKKGSTEPPRQKKPLTSFCMHCVPFILMIANSLKKFPFLLLTAVLVEEGHYYRLYKKKTTTTTNTQQQQLRNLFLQTLGRSIQARLLADSM